MSDTLGLGKIITTDQPRDAIHIAVAPVVAAEDLYPGQHIGLLDDGTAGRRPKHIGIVDPFLPKDTLIEPGQKFWMFLYPYTITSLNHHWTHPAFEPTTNTADNPSEKWLRSFAQNLDISYEELLEGAQSFLDHDEYMIDGGKFEGVGVPPEFWDHFQNVRPQKNAIQEHQKHSFFSCSC